MGTLILYVATIGLVRIRLDGGEWQTTEMAVVPPYVPHEVVSEARHIIVVKVEADSTGLNALPAALGRGAVHAPEFVRLARQRYHELSEQSAVLNLQVLHFDRTLFDATLATRRVDRRIAAVLARINDDSAAPEVAEEYAALANLSFSRFLHLFMQEICAPFCSLRTCKRGCSLLHYVNQDANLVHVALDAGYIDRSG